MTGQKWRPSLALLVTAVLLIVLTLPLLGLLFFQLYGNQLVRQTEESLIGQSTVLAAAFSQALPDSASLGAIAPNDPSPEPINPLVPSLDLAAGPILPRPDNALPTDSSADAAYLKIGAALSVLAAETQKVTLAGFRITDPNGIIIGGSGKDIGLSLAHIPEVAIALTGAYAPVLRLRSLNRVPPPLYSISRSTKVRVFIALPVIHKGRVAGVIYASRTPNNVLKNLYEERNKVFLASLAILSATGLIGYVFWRGVTRPITALMDRAKALGTGDRTALAPLPHYGTREIAQLSGSIRGMAEALFKRTDYMRTFAAHVTHELKSPLTAILGAAELMRDNSNSMKPKQHQQFIDNIIADTQRMTQLVGRLRQLAEAEAPELGGTSSVGKCLPDLRQRFPKATISVDNPDMALQISLENLVIVMGNLIENSVRNDASIIDIAVSQDKTTEIIVADNGKGVSANNRERLFDAFFTTHREIGGTGMGLGIVRALLRAHGGEIGLEQSTGGAKFRISLPGAAQGP